MPEVICNTSPLQYLHQIGLLHILPALAGQVTVPPAVLEEISAGQALGVNLPDLSGLDWIVVRGPVSPTSLRLVTDLGPGETQVLALALETPDSMVILDDGLARQTAEALKIRFAGTLGLLLDAKKAGLLSVVAPLLDQLQALRFRLAPRTRTAILKMAGEIS
ncbi:MAG: nucleic acid-binding protein [Candidatus Handelsmanbacteria bacterium RIFCSPLOWO2_12_FULL_64_10]|uniref:Nucleic acid-binding protein n=1 Tax=Handelsmanbacteria sp. (strain RIFCSPLOWO2_12_FULL_64_10) TaxID=1817868 RepID=A0A1F6C978_HANXR|nr:MAG: nucleic acid-binding protein [Candidatus Handelsmanbacteria bacterium RIFCSPLOWO2_12_FULL_64_10]